MNPHIIDKKKGFFASNHVFNILKSIKVFHFYGFLCILNYDGIDKIEKIIYAYINKREVYYVKYFKL